MTYQLPTSSSKLNSPDHAKLHRVIAIDDVAPEQSVLVTPTGTLRATNSLYQKTYRLGASAISLGASGAQLQAINGILSYNLNAITEYLYAGFCVENYWDTVSDIDLHVHGFLTNAETAGDIIRARLEVRYGTNGDSIADGQIKSQILTNNYNIGSDNAQYTLHEVQFILDHDAVNNVVELGDFLFVKFYLYDVTTAPIVNNFNVVGMCAKLRSKQLSEEVE